MLRRALASFAVTLAATAAYSTFASPIPTDAERYLEVLRQLRAIRSELGRLQHDSSELSSVANLALAPASTRATLDENNRRSDAASERMSDLSREKREIESRIEVQYFRAYGEMSILPLKDISRVRYALIERDTFPLVFESREAIARWAAFAGLTSAELAQAHRQLLRYQSLCAKGLSVLDRVSVPVRSLQIEVCAEGITNLVNYEFARYELRKEDERILLTRHLSMTYEGDPKNRDAAIERLERSRRCAIDFFAKHGIELDLTTRVNAGPENLAGVFNIELWDDLPRSNAGKIAILSADGSKRTPGESCSLLIHELGHHLGLDDTYRDEGCPARSRFEPKGNIMSSSWIEPEDAHFADWQIKALLSPLCGE